MSGGKPETTRKKIVFEGLEEYRRDIGIVEHEIDSFKEKVRDLNRELEQLSKYMELFAELRKKLF